MPALKFSAWLAPDDAAALASFVSHAGLLSKIYPHWYVYGQDGLPQRHPHATEEARQRLIAAARTVGVEIWPRIALERSVASGSPADPGLQRLFSDETLRQAHGAALLRLAREDGAQGVDLDYGSIPAADGDGRTVFVSGLCTMLHGAGLKVGVVMHLSAAASYSASTAAAYLPLDCDRLQALGPYPGLGTISSGNAPGPIAPPAWCAEHLAFLTTQIPPSKLEWALPACGSDWSPDGGAEDLSWDAWSALVKAHPPERRDPPTNELTLRHDGREAWTNDAISLSAKLREVRLSGVSEAALWGLGAEDPRLWALVDSLPKEFLGTEEA
jgi:peptidoglycan-N-acetylglucosamine deacetylase